MTAFNHACSSHTDMLELDCQLTKDGVVVVSHDDDLFRITGNRILISETAFKDLPNLKNQLKADFYWGRGGVVSGLDRRIPPLEDLMIAHPRIPLNIDIKVDNDQLIGKVADLVRKYQREDITVWGNRSTRVTDKLLKEHPDIGVFFPARRVLSVVALFYIGLLPFVPIRETHFEMLMPSIALKEGIFSFRPDWKWRLLIRVLDFFIMNRHLFQHLQDRGIEVYLWVLNEEDDWRRAFSYGATGVMTDYPTKLRQFLEDNPQYIRQRTN